MIHANQQCCLCARFYFLPVYFPFCIFVCLPFWSFFIFPRIRLIFAFVDFSVALSFENFHEFALEFQLKSGWLSWWKRCRWHGAMIYALWFTYFAYSFRPTSVFLVSWLYTTVQATTSSRQAFYAWKQLLLSARLSHRNSVCLSVTRVDQSKTVQARITKSSP